MGATGGKGTGGKGKGGKGKGGGNGCGPGEVAICLTPAVHSALAAAVNNATMSTSRADGCLPGAMRVCLDTSVALDVLPAIAASLNIGVTKSKKGKGKKGKGNKGKGGK